MYKNIGAEKNTSWCERKSHNPEPYQKSLSHLENRRTESAKKNICKVLYKDPKVQEQKKKEEKGQIKQKNK